MARRLLRAWCHGLEARARAATAVASSTSVGGCPPQFALGMSNRLPIRRASWRRYAHHAAAHGRRPAFGRRIRVGMRGCPGRFIKLQNRRTPDDGIPAVFASWHLPAAARVAWLRRQLTKHHAQAAAARQWSVGRRSGQAPTNSPVTVTTGTRPHGAPESANSARRLCWDTLFSRAKFRLGQTAPSPATRDRTLPHPRRAHRLVSIGKKYRCAASRTREGSAKIAVCHTRSRTHREEGSSATMYRCGDKACDEVDTPPPARNTLGHVLRTRTPSSMGRWCVISLACGMDGCRSSSPTLPNYSSAGQY